MGFSIKETSSNDKNIIKDFNNELKLNGYNFKIPFSNDNLSNNDFILKKNFILIENNNLVRGGYTLKQQWFKINDDILKIGYYYNPTTAGLFNKRYNICGLTLLNDAVKKNSYLFSLGMGSYSNSLPKLLKTLKWRLKKVPFFFKVINPNSFLKNINYFKNSKLNTLLIYILEKTGIGWVLIKFIFLLTSSVANIFHKRDEIECEKVNFFNDDINNIWEKSKKNNSFIALRNNEYINFLYKDKKFIKLKFIEKNEIIGWSIAVCNKVNNHKHFGNMNLGSIIDCLALKDKEVNIIKKTLKILETEGADLVVSNQSHIQWKKAFWKNGFLRGPSNFIFASSEPLSKKLGFQNKLNDDMHITRGDGDGPINL